MWIYIEKDDRRPRHNRYLESYNGYVRTLEFRTSIWKDDRKVKVSISEYKTGINRRQGNNRWFRWEKTTSYGFFRNAAGTIVPYTITGKMSWGNPHSAFYQLETRDSDEFGFLVGHSNLKTAYQEAVHDVFGIYKLSDVYPVADHYGIDNYEHIPKGLVRAFRNTNTRSFVEEVFDKKNYRKDLVKAVANAVPTFIPLAAQFKNLVPIDWIIDFLRLNTTEVQYGVYDTRKLRSLLTQINPKSYRSLLRADIRDQSAMQIANLALINSREGIRVETDRHFRSWGELHDTLIGNRAHFHYSKPFEDQPVKLTKLAERFDKQTSLIQPATHTKQMVEWGNAMSNCIASYRPNALKGQGEYAAVIYDGKLVGNLEVRNRRLIQLLGKCNQPLPEPLRSKVVHELKNVGVDTNGHWWGQNDN